MPLVDYFRKSNQKALFDKFAESAISEAAKAAVSLAVASVIPVPAVADAAASLSKEFIQTILTRASEMEHKLDRLISEPFKTGMQLLLESAKHQTSTLQEVESRDALLDFAHISFVRAHSLVANSREDSVFVRSLDCLALAARTGRGKLAKDGLAEINADMSLLRERVQLLSRTAADWERDVMSINKFFGRGDWGGKPIGYDVQLIWVKKQERDARQIIAQAHHAEAQFSVLERIVTLAEKPVG